MATKKAVRSFGNNVPIPPWVRCAVQTSLKEVQANALVIAGDNLHDGACLTKSGVLEVARIK